VAPAGAGGQNLAMTPAEAVLGLYEAYQARSWGTARNFLHADAVVDMPATGERLVGRPDLLDFQRSYPEPWGDLAVLRVVGGTTEGDVVVAAEVEVRAPAQLFRLAAFWECRDGLLWRGVEYWTTVGGQSPPPERRQPLGPPEVLWRTDGMRIEVLPEKLSDQAVALWHEVGLTRPWNDPDDDLRRAMNGPASTILAAVDGEHLVGTAMVGHDGHRGWVYYLAVSPSMRGRGLGARLMAAGETWLRELGVPKVQLMVRRTNQGVKEFYHHLGYREDDVAVLSRRLRS
jgi:ribosomal protein S18 acetylase RimI-like enzyme